ncbi:MAG: peptidylprolyl isomerase [Coriobacteriales bacterium]
MKRLVALLTAAALGLCLAGCAQGGSQEAPSQGQQQGQEQQEPEEQPASADEPVAGLVDAQTGAIGPVILFDPYASGIHHATLTVKGYDPMELEIYSSTAPETSALFCKLVRRGYYDGVRISTLMPGLYAGVSASSKSGQQVVTAEFEEAGYGDNHIGLKRGVIAMGRADSSGETQGPQIIRSDASELYIFLTNASYLDGTYAGFAKITQGMAVFDQICQDIQKVSPLEEDGSIERKKSAPLIKSIELED